MDMCMVDVTRLEKVKAGDAVEIFGSTIPIEDLAEACGTIPYEILTGISPRIPRIFRFD
jgi:alanine racemase